MGKNGKKWEKMGIYVKKLEKMVKNGKNRKNG